MPFPAKTSADAIIQSAADIIRGGGLAALSMRSLASRLGVRASSLYRHFHDRSAIEQTLAERSSRQLLECMQQASQSLSGERAVMAASRAYLDYANSEASFYDILMQGGFPPERMLGVMAPLWDYFVRVVSEMTHIHGDTTAAAALWSFLHGFTALSRTGQIPEAITKAAFTRGAQALLRGLNIPEAEAAGSPA